MYVIMDMGTTNTRLYLCSNNAVVDCVKGAFGAGFGKKNGRKELCKRVEDLLGDLLNKCTVNECDVESIVAVGMAGSEIGLLDVPHISLPADACTLAKNVRMERIDGINIPFLFISGVKKTDGRTRICDMMRGEETETVGLASVIESDGDKVFVLPGTHNKIVHVSRDGMITDCVTTFSGELLDNIISNTILAGQVSHDFQIIESEVLKGAAYAKENGLNAALFKIRVMAKNGIGVDALSSFLYGCVIGEDICLINRIAQGKKIYVFGRKTLREVYAILLGEDAVLLDDDVCSSAMVNGAMLVKQIYDAHSRRKTIIERIEKEKVIAIVRNAEKESCVEAMRALYDGGIRLAEVTFDRSGKKSVQEIAEMIRMLVSEFGNDMCIGAGTVTRTAEVFAAFEAGASYIISPNCDPEIISLTRKLGMVSMPAAYTATEITAAMNHGADYVKLFPADQVSEDYVKAVCAPLSDAKLFAVGGVNADNASKFLKMGFCGIGVGSNLYDKKLIAEKNFDALRELAKKYSSLSKSNDID